MSSILEKIEGMNKKIESLNAQKSKIDAKKEVIEGQLKKGLQEYKDTYGIDLTSMQAYGGGYKSLAARIKAEYDKVQKTVSEELEFAQSVVEKIESGDIEEANRLLGVEVEEPVEDSVEEDIGDTEDTAPTVTLKEEADVVSTGDLEEDFIKPSVSGVEEVMSGLELPLSGMTVEEEDEINNGLDDLLNGGRIDI